MVWIPSLKVGQFALTDLTGARPGRLILVRRAAHTHAYLTFGQDEQVSHVVYLEEGIQLRAFGMAHVGREKGVVLDVAERLRLTLDDGHTYLNRLPVIVGCVGISTFGPILCASEGVANFGGHAPVYFCLPTWRPMPVEQSWFIETVWFTKWELSFWDEESQERVRVLGSALMGG